MSDDRSVTPPEPEIGALLREHMREAVAWVEPQDGTLEFLRRAVTARRKQRRTAFATSAAMVLAVAGGLVFAGQGLVRSGGGVSASLGVGFGADRARAAGAGPGRGPSGGRASSGGSPQLAYPVTTSVPSRAGVASQGPAPVVTVAASGVAGLPGCQRSSLSAVETTQDPMVGDFTYDTVVATVKTACKVSGPPRLYVYDATGTLDAAIPVYRADPTLAPGLPPVATWGRTLLLNPGDKYVFEFAWAPSAGPCTGGGGATASPSKSGEPSDGDTSSVDDASPPLSVLTVMGPAPSTQDPTAGGGKARRDGLTIAYAVNGVASRAMIPLVDGCGSAVYVTDIFENGEYPEYVEQEPSGSPSPS